MLPSTRTAATARPRIAPVCSALALLVCAGYCRPALAQQAVNAPSQAASASSSEAEAEQRRTQAKAKYEQGAEAYSMGRYADAVQSFLAADRLAPSAPLSYNIARAQEKLGNAAGALRWYRDYLRRSPSAANAATVRATVASLSQSLAKTGVQQLTVLTTPNDARVQIDDLPPVTSPWTGELAPGRHRLVVSREGYVDTRVEVGLSVREARDVRVALVQATPELTSAAPSLALGTVSRSEDSGEKRLGAWPWVTIGVGAAALGGALTFELMRRSAEDDAKHASQIDYQAQLDREQSRQTASRVFLGVGGAFLAAGGVMLLLDRKSSSSVAGAGLMCLPQGCSASAIGRF